jgi:riboflavin kinase / FMN adenylyltransferase
VRTAQGLGEFPADRPAPVVALGTFDGVHLGHRQVIGAAVSRARVLGGTAVAVTFEPHPLEVLRPSATPILLTTLDERLALFEEIGADVALVLPFDIEFSRLSATTWLDEILAERLRVREICAGSSYSFGFRREGTAARLDEWGRARGVPVHLIPPVLVGGEPVSSTRIRSALWAGLVDEAARLLGRSYTLRGRVIRGSGRGHTLGFPTANLEIPSRKVLPGRGVYATIAEVGGRRYGGATNIGYRPTFGGSSLSVETHLLEFQGELVGETIILSFVQRIRAERAFPGPEALVRQIHLDVAQVRELLAAAGPSIIQ